MLTMYSDLITDLGFGNDRHMIEKYIKEHKLFHFSHKYFTMTAIQNLPNELLLKIFKELDKMDVNQCQTVSKHWYLSAHRQFVNEISLCGPSGIQEFVKAVDQNTNENNLLGVRSIILDNSADLESYNHNYQIGEQDIQKLFFRFPNLATIQVRGDLTIIKAFEDKKLCESLFKSLPWLQVEVGPNERYTASNLHKLRHLWTTFRVDKIDGLLWEFGSAAEFLTSAPHLKMLRGYDPIDFLEGELAPIFEKFTN